MSVDFYAVTSAWPTMAAMQQCLAEREYPVQLKRFPLAVSDDVVDDGILAAIENEDAYLQGSLYPPAKGLVGKPASDRASDVAMINGALHDAGAKFSVGPQHYVVSMHIGGNAAEFAATSYVLSGLINCFGGFGWEPQGNGFGKADFAESLVGQVQMMKAHLK